MLNKFRLIDVANTAIDADVLNITATNRPLGSHTMDFGSPPIMRPPLFIGVKSATGNDCFGAAETETVNKIKQINGCTPFLRILFQVYQPLYNCSSLKHKLYRIG